MFTDAEITNGYDAIYSCLFTAPLDARAALALLNECIAMPSTTSTLSASLPPTTGDKPLATTLDLLARAVLHLQAGDETRGREALLAIPTHSLHQLLVTVPTLMTEWPHRLLLIKTLRSLAPWSLAEVLVRLTCSGIFTLVTIHQPYSLPIVSL